MIRLGKLRGRDKCEGIGLEGKIILKWILKKEYVGVEWIYLPYDKECAIIPSIQSQTANYLH